MSPTTFVCDMASLSLTSRRGICHIFASQIGCIKCKAARRLNSCYQRRCRVKSWSSHRSRVFSNNRATVNDFNAAVDEVRVSVDTVVNRSKRLLAF